MAIVFNSDAGTISGLSVGGLPDGIVDSDTLASGAGGVSGVTSSADATAISIDSSERVGIGAATSPNTLMHIKAASGSVLRVEETGGSYIDIEAGGSTGHIKSKTGNDITFSPGGTNHLQLYSSGRAKSQFTARAWVNWNSTGTVAILDSHNVSSVSDTSVGNFYVYIDVDMSNANYAVTGCTTNSSRGNMSFQDLQSGRVSAATRETDTGTYTDYGSNSAIIFGD